MIALLAAVPLQVAAQTSVANDAILLDDTSPILEAVITPAVGTTGAVQIEVSDASVSILDANGDAVFRTLHPNVQNVTVHFAPDAQPHTVVVERLPNAAESYVRLNALAEIPVVENAVAVSGDTLASGEGTQVTLDETAANVIMWDVSESDTITARFTDPNTRAEIVDTLSNMIVGQLESAAQISGFNITLEAGSYALAMQGRSIASVDLMPSVIASGLRCLD